MTKTVKFALLVIVILAVILGLNAFLWVVTTVIKWGIISLVIAGLVYLYYKLNKKNQA